MDCQKCGGATWDNRRKVEGGWKGPVFKCKDTNCGWVQWPPREKKAQSNGAPRVKWTAADMGKVYAWAVKTAGKEISTFAGTHKVPFTVENVVAGAATLFIGATNHGAPPVEKPTERPRPQDSNEPPMEAADASAW